MLTNLVGPGLGPARQIRRIAVVLTVAGLLLNVAHCQGAASAPALDVAPAVRTRRHVLQAPDGPAPSDPAAAAQQCILDKCYKAATACQADPQCARGLACQARCTAGLDPTKPKSVEEYFACIVVCLFKYQLHNANASTFNSCATKNKCLSLPPPLGRPAFCLPPKGGPSKVRAEDLRGRYNVLAGVTKVDCQSSQFIFGFPKPGYFTLQEYFEPQQRVIRLPRYRFLGFRDYYTRMRGVLAGLPDATKYVVLDATAGNKYVLLMYCSEGYNARGGYVLGKDACRIPKAVKKRFAKKLVSSVWAAYYDLPLSAFCRPKVRKFP